jgi:hypothetical protein
MVPPVDNFEKHWPKGSLHEHLYYAPMSLLWLVLLSRESESEREGGLRSLLGAFGRATKNTLKSDVDPSGNILF